MGTRPLPFCVSLSLQAPGSLGSWPLPSLSLFVLFSRTPAGRNSFLLYLPHTTYYYTCLLHILLLGSYAALVQTSLPTYTLKDTYSAETFFSHALPPLPCLPRGEEGKRRERKREEAFPSSFLHTHHLAFLLFEKAGLGAPLCLTSTTMPLPLSLTLLYIRENTSHMPAKHYSHKY